VTMSEAIYRFLLSKRAENSSPCTIRAYRADLVDFSDFIGCQQGPDLLSRQIVRAFLALLHRRGAGKSTARRKLSAIKSFVGWLRAERIIEEECAEKIVTIKPPKIPETLPDVPSPEEMTILLDGGDFPTAFPERDRLLLELMYGAGLRVSEAAQIRLEDLRPEQNAILINGKGGPYGKSAKFRLVPLNPKSRVALAAYLAERNRVLNKKKTETTALFFRVRGRLAHTKCAGSTVPINVRSVHRMLLHMTKVRGLPAMHPHLLRHACATHMLDNGCPLDVISHLLGHDSLDVTAHYAQVSTRLMMTTYNQAHPHARLDLRKPAGNEREDSAVSEERAV
jgi:integrase/recombinase XerC